ncbi:conserved hypothetical protein [Neospora caninum Liverpool]|uniref:Uncharacterized protein n=1 Tax=Neospora caninum (strain Liverpool) TaxID=572307 RepID=F0VIQ1_NEOCL|nr:conserved hypothetical protein [Neospora caninum Liverpool]CBZ53612.1 conserved hypothetical protein [Neospora caninum Liverpool]|eukprot:XP_003883644.1 conserved hypothetical protein [Neospora caninum Liverpool]
MSNAARDGKLSSTAARWNRAAGSKPQGFLNSRQPPDLVPSTSASDNGRRRPTGLGTSTCPVYGSPVGSASPQLNRKPGATRLSQKEGISNNPVRVSRRCSLPLSREDASLTTSRGLPGSCAATAFTKLKREPQQKRACISSHKKIQGVASTSQAAVTILQDGIQRYGPSAGSEHMLRAELAAAEEAIRTGTKQLIAPCIRPPPSPTSHLSAKLKTLPPYTVLVISFRIPNPLCSSAQQSS